MSVVSSARFGGTGQTSALKGFLVGLLTGLILAAVVALYVSRVPVPFMDRGVSRNPQADLAETERNKDWNPNAVLGNNVSTPVIAAPAVEPNAPSTPSTPSTPIANDPLGDLVASKKPNPSPQVERYAVQAGAYSAEADAKSQRARLVLLGVQAQVVAAELNGKSVYRVRTAPVAQKFQAEAIQDQLKAAGVESSLVRVAP
jgi:cell division protein FtsN